LEENNWIITKCFQLEYGPYNHKAATKQDYIKMLNQHGKLMQMESAFSNITRKSNTYNSPTKITTMYE